MKLHLGAGGRILEGFINLDRNPEHGAIAWEAPILSYPDESIDFIYSEHFIEHLEKPVALSLFKECNRVLKHGGKLRISTPSLAVIVQAYLNNELDIYKTYGIEYASQCDLLNGALRSWEHIYVWDLSELMLCLEKVGSWSGHRNQGHAGPLESRPYCRDLILESTK